MRLFIAVNLCEEIKQAIRNAIDRFPVAHPPWRWVGDDAFHITLKFLGDTSEDHVPQIINQLQGACRACHGFDIRLRDMGGFPNLTKPRVLFYKVMEGADELGHIAAAVDEALYRDLGIPMESKPFRAHVTIARIKRPLQRDIISQFAAAPVLTGAAQRVQSVDLMRSELRREGARYHIVKEIALDAAA
ncbi:MAG: RNA 2',3'-cyclic phosphodiesterase [Candidatus Latescibacterota bacterium]